MSSTEQMQALTPADHPGLFQAADAAAARQRHAYLRAVRSRLALIVAAAVFATLTLRLGDTAIDLFAIGAALALVGAVAVELALVSTRPDRLWAESRTLATSVKTLAWRYATCAAPFPAGDGQADQRFTERLRALQQELPDVPLAQHTTETITERMRTLRSAPLAERKEAYLIGRVLDQQDWYETRAQHHLQQARFSRTAMLVIEVLGVAGALSEAFGVTGLNKAGATAVVVAATAVAAIIAWVATRRHSAKAAAYRRATAELGAIRDQLDRDLDERQWSTAVADAEAAITREHATWRATRTT
ncbi:DUF4231 domain-containing protein [Saccharopolyspora hirsuta]|uniref:DUF4231 domain-containing protein n=1 Tax=Saccharopolyspora hirsuta TaxID=1837 RepID=A0A5M7BXG5_SACHI|nr:DUF4231 domain-containing protein [Saccharopolyspora hirsuta]KAA5831911.1 DUF4231 domain-containing protein [Saccharopolyspora hirsuta]